MGGKESQISFQPSGIRLELYQSMFAKSCASYFHLATVTRVTQKLCFCVLTELDVAEEKNVERKTD